MKAAIRHKIEQSYGLYTAIKSFCDTDILDGITNQSYPARPPKRYGSFKPKAKVVEEKKTETETTDTFRFSNIHMTMAEIAGVSDPDADDWSPPNPLYYSVVHDSGCNQTITWDKSRFINEVKPVSVPEWTSTPKGPRRIEGYGTMRVNAKRDGKPVTLLFDDTAYCPTLENTLVLNNRLKKQGVIWDQINDRLFNKNTGLKICDVEDHFDLAVLEYHPVHYPHPIPAQANSIQPRHQEVATPWIWHLRMGHCRPAVVKKLRAIPDVVMKEGAAPLTIECETCAVSKMHKLVNRMPTNRATKPFQILHFDLIIAGGTQRDCSMLRDRWRGQRGRRGMRFLFFCYFPPYLNSLMHTRNTKYDAQLLLDRDTCSTRMRIPPLPCSIPPQLTVVPTLQSASLTER